MRITKVYTRTGDGGTTHLVGGASLAKDATRIEAYGTVDELNSLLGVARTDLRALAPSDATRRLDRVLEALQHDLFDVGADLATPAAARWEGMDRVDDGDVTRLERWIDTLNGDLPPLKEFVLPGGGPVGATLHVARTVCRRAERRVVTLMHDEPDVGAACLKYLNRLSDLLFVMARWSARSLSEDEFTWRRKADRMAEPDPLA